MVPLTTTKPPVVVLGGGRYLARVLVPMLIARGCRVRVLERRLTDLSGVRGADREMADPLDEQSLVRGFVGAELVYDFASEAYGPEVAASVERTAGRVGTQRLIRVERLEAPLSRPAREGVTVVRAAPVVGAGSPWFVVLRTISDRLPLVPSPAWMRGESEPIAVADAGVALADLADRPPPGQLFDLVGGERVTYRELLVRVGALHGRSVRLMEGGAAGDAAVRLLTRTTLRGEREAMALVSEVAPAPSVGSEPSLLAALGRDPLPLAKALQAAFSGQRRRIV